MTSIALITPSFGPDFELCADLCRSVVENAPASAFHHIIVPRNDLKLFGRLAGPRTIIHCESDFLPRSFVSLPFSKFTVNLRRPFPPVRGWVLQQIVKLSAAAASQEDVVVLVDSDIEFVKPFTAETFFTDNKVRFFHKPGAVDERLPRHMIWHRGARSLLGLSPGHPPYVDYITSMIAWDPRIVRQLLARVSAVSGIHWASAITGRLHFSEWTLYGVFVDEVLGGEANSFSSEDPLCLAHWGTTPLTGETAGLFFADLKSTDIAAMISAKSRTPLETKRNAFAAFRARTSATSALHAEA